MKTFFSTLVLSLVAVIGTAQTSLSEKKEQHDYVVMTKNVQQLKPILLAAKELAKEDGNSFGKFEIIVCGKNIGDLTNQKDLEPHLKEAKNLGANIIACGFSLKKFNVDPNLLPKEMEIVENGILHSFERQKQGYFNLEL